MKNKRLLLAIGIGAVALVAVIGIGVGVSRRSMDVTVPVETTEAVETTEEVFEWEVREVNTRFTIRALRDTSMYSEPRDSSDVIKIIKSDDEWIIGYNTFIHGGMTGEYHAVILAGDVNKGVGFVKATDMQIVFDEDEEIIEETTEAVEETEELVEETEASTGVSVAETTKAAETTAPTKTVETTNAAYPTSVPTQPAPTQSAPQEVADGNSGSNIDDVLASLGGQKTAPPVSGDMGDGEASYNPNMNLE